jgi:hypothetical protein
VQPFLHDRLQRLSELLDAGSTALRTCSRDELTAADVVGDLLAQAADRYAALGLHVEENAVLALSAELQAARRGVVLATGERTSRRRELERTVALRVLVQALDRLRDAVRRDQDRLAAARESLAPVVVYALQSGLVAPLQDGDDAGRAAEVRWRALTDDATTRPIVLQLLTGVSAADALLVLLDLLEAVAPVPAPSARPVAPSQRS